MKAKKALGQHFLKSPDVSQKIVEYLRGLAIDQILEVGPGHGALTEHLVPLNKNLIIVETDRDLIPILNAKFPHINVINANFLKLDLRQYIIDGDSGIVGNFPYNISSQIVFKAIENIELISFLVGMFQKEMAERICSAPGSKVYGAISVITQSLFSTSLLFNVDRKEFDPVPNVDSTVISLVKRQNINPIVHDPLFKRVVKQTFAQRRKMLRNTLKNVLDKSFF